MTEFFYVLLGLAFAGYFALAGCDYGTGMLLRRVARTESERRVTLGAVGPFFLGNEVWLLGALGLLFGAFPLAEGSLLAGLYPLMIPLLVALPVFTAAVQLRSRFDVARPLWDFLIVVSAFVIAFGWGAAFGAIAQGFPLNFGPLPVVAGAATCAVLARHAAVFLTVRAPEVVAARARRIAERMTPVSVGLLVIVGLTAVAGAGAVRQPWLAATALAALLGVVLASDRMLRARRHGWALVTSGMAAAAPVLICGLAMLPYLYVHSDPSLSLTVDEAVAGSESLRLLMVAALPMLPVLALCQAVTWWIWRRAPRRPTFY